MRRAQLEKPSVLSGEACCRINSPSLQDAPAAVGIPQGHAGRAVGLQVAGLDRNLGDLQTGEGLLARVRFRLKASEPLEAGFKDSPGRGGWRREDGRTEESKTDGKTSS